MRKITEESIDAFYKRKRFKKQNTEVHVGDFTTMLRLHGNTIAILHENGDLDISTCGWHTNTTIERLNGLRKVHVKRVKGDLVLNNQGWDGKLIRIL
jgi:hypothetical protein